MKRFGVPVLLAAGTAFLVTACTTSPAGSDSTSAAAATPATAAAASGSASASGASPVSGPASASGAAAASDVSGTVTFLLPNTTTTRFVEHDAPAFVAAMKELAPNVTVDIQNAEGQSDKQLAQAETAINSGTKAIVLTAADPSLSGAVLQKAADANIPVIGYEHEALDGPVFTQVIFDPYKVGVAQGEYFAQNLPPAGADGVITIGRVYGNNGDNYTTKDLEGQDSEIKPLIESGKIEVACEDYATGWDPAAAQQLTEQCLTKTQNNIDAVVAMNDGTASGAIAALQGQGLAGKIPVYGGQDANLDALRFILTGDQTSTVFKDYALEGETAAKITAAAISGGQPPSDLINGTFDNNAMAAPAANLDVKSVDITTMQTVIDAGLYTKDQLCQGLTDVDFCA
jgi:ABC-type xylose transport system substrate-binding protein